MAWAGVGLVAFFGGPSLQQWGEGSFFSGREKGKWRREKTTEKRGDGEPANRRGGEGARGGMGRMGRMGLMGLMAGEAGKPKAEGL